MNGLMSGLILSWRSHFFTQFATLSILTASFTLITVFWNLSENMGRILTAWGENAQMTVYLAEEWPEKDFKELQSEINQLPSLLEANFLSKKEAYNLFLKTVKDYAPVLSEGEGFESALPASFELRFTNVQNQNRHEFLEQTAKNLKKSTIVQDVSFGQSWIENYASFTKGIRYAGMILMIVLLSGSLFIIANSIRTSIMQRREEIEVLELIGATSALIQRPYIFEGAVLGGIAGSLSLLFNYFAYLGQVQLVQTSWAFTGLSESLTYLNPTYCLVIFFASVLVGALGSFITVTQINSGWAAAERVR